MKRVWNYKNENENYKIEFKRSSWTGKQTLTINDTVLPLEKTNEFKHSDIPIKIGEKDAVLSLIGAKVDIIVDGFSLTTGKEYVPPVKQPWYGKLFCGLCIAIPIGFLGGAVPIIMGIFSAMLCYRTSISPKMNTFVKVLLSIIITIAAWILTFLIVTSLTAAINNL